MPRTLKGIFFALLLVVLAVPAWAGETWKLTILHTNDRHGRMEMAPYQWEDSPFSEAARDLGGLARMATAIEQIRARTNNPLVLVDTGDVFTRGPWHEKWYGEPEIEAMNAMGYDMLCVGNNEFKAINEDPVSKGMMLRLMRRSRFPWLAANLTLGDGAPPGCDSLAFVEGIHPFVVRSFEGVRVGFLGLTTAASSEYPHLKGWTVGDPVEAARKWVAKARAECDILIAVTHLGARTDMALVGKVEGIDAIIGGHSHTFVSEAFLVPNQRGIDVPIAQAGEGGVVLGRLDLAFHREGEDGWRLADTTVELVPIDRSFAESPALSRMLSRYLVESEDALEAQPVPAPAG
ncbi:MAG TPA: bifunctional UDP-sugar hydrolase/5'-nucleotidase [Armatimonadota bacterium]|nr:bifunctional UDP-sugar hydrolase/5'-nucleotidase [Armatimonadota bacterium]